MNTQSPLHTPAPAWWQRIYSASGRARRLEYGIYLLVFMILLYILSRFLEAFAVAAQQNGEPLEGMMGVTVVGVITFVCGFLPYLFATIRRLHDFNQKGVWAIICFVPIVGQVAAIVLTVIDGSRHANRYGPNPKHEELLTEMKKYEVALEETVDDELPNPEEGL